MHPKGLADLYTLSDYMRYDGTGVSNLAAEGKVGAMGGNKKAQGRLYGSDVYVSTQQPKSGNNTSNLYAHKEALALALQKAPRVQSEYKTEYLGNLVVADVLLGVIETRDAFGVELKA